MAMIRQSGMKKIGMLGLSFKPGTDDLRESPLVTLAARLLEEGFTLSVYDSNVLHASKHSPVAAQLWESYGPVFHCLNDDIDALVKVSEVGGGGPFNCGIPAGCGWRKQWTAVDRPGGYLPGVSMGDRQASAGKLPMKTFTEWLLWITVVMALALLIEPAYLDSSDKKFILIIGAIGLWRYSMGAMHLVRGIWFGYVWRFLPCVVEWMKILGVICRAMSIWW